MGNNPAYDAGVLDHAAMFAYSNAPVFGSTPQPPYGAFGVSQDLKLPYVENFNVTFERQIGARTVAQIGYVGTRGHRLGLMLDINAPQPTAAGLSQARRPYNALFPDLAAINQLQSIGRSKYNSLQMSLIQGNGAGVSGRRATPTATRWTTNRSGTPCQWISATSTSTGVTRHSTCAT